LKFFGVEIFWRSSFGAPKNFISKIYFGALPLERQKISTPKFFWALFLWSAKKFQLQKISTLEGCINCNTPQRTTAHCNTLQHTLQREELTNPPIKCNSGGMHKHHCTTYTLQHAAKPAATHAATHAAKGRADQPPQKMQLWGDAHISLHNNFAKPSLWTHMYKYLRTYIYMFAYL